MVCYAISKLPINDFLRYPSQQKQLNPLVTPLKIVNLLPPTTLTLHHSYQITRCNIKSLSNDLLCVPISCIIRISAPLCSTECHAKCFSLNLSLAVRAELAKWRVHGQIAKLRLMGANANKVECTAKTKLVNK